MVSMLATKSILEKTEEPVDKDCEVDLNTSLSMAPWTFSGLYAIRKKTSANKTENFFILAPFRLILIL
jgi:hypothetical protein